MCWPNGHYVHKVEIEVAKWCYADKYFRLVATANTCEWVF